jgi:MbtH protein
MAKLRLGETSPAWSVLVAHEHEDNSDVLYTVVVNDEEQYSIWPVHRQVPSGWRQVGHSGPKADCLRYIDEVWTDMRPLSVRNSVSEE